MGEEEVEEEGKMRQQQKQLLLRRRLHPQRKQLRQRQQVMQEMKDRKVMWRWLPASSAAVGSKSLLCARSSEAGG